MQQEMGWLYNDRCGQCGKEGSATQKLYECEAPERLRVELPRGTSNRQQQAGFTVKLFERRTGLRTEDTTHKQE